MPPSPTARKFKKRQQCLDVESFARNLVGEDAELALALADLDKVVYSGDVSQLTEDLFGKPHLFEFVFSVVDDGIANILREHLFSLITPDLQAPFPLSRSALVRFSKFFYFLPDPEDDAKPSSLAKDMRFAQSSQEVLSSLGLANFNQQMGILQEHQEDENEADLLGMAKKKRSQRQAKQGNKSQKVAPKINPRPFQTIGEEVPSTEEDARDLVLRLLGKQRTLLEHFLDMLREPTFSTVIRDQYMPVHPIVDAKDANMEIKVEKSATEVESVDSSSSAYPLIQPFKASLYFDSAEGLGEWRIFMSTTAIGDLRSYHHKDRKNFDVIIKKMRELSNGHFSDDNQKRLKGPSKNIPIFEAKLTGDLRLVYQVDCMSEYESKAELQVLRVFGIFTHAQMDSRMWESLSAQLSSRGAEYRKRITFRTEPRVRGDNVYRPKSWPDICDVEESTNGNSISSLVNSSDLQSIHQWLVLEKYSAFSQALLNCIEADTDASPVFAVSPYEREIIEHPSSCYVLGRSGTGKTTTMAFKMFGIERTALINSSLYESKPRQLFITQSHVLAGRVKEYFAKLSDFLSAASGNLSRPVELPKSEPDNGLGDPEEDEESNDLPKRFSELQDSDFPLFLTFDKLCKLLEADLGFSFARQTYTKEHKRAGRRFKLANVTARDELDVPQFDENTDTVFSPTYAEQSSESSRSSIVTFESFCQNYWPHFPQDLTKNLDPALVFSEFMGVIKGSAESLNSEKPYLSQETYESLSERTQSTFATQRLRVYKLFEKYIALKRQFGDYDAADRSHAIIRCMKEGYKQSVDFLYVDEAQDNLIIDAFLLRSLCHNPHGLFWAGDTAQTIAVGSSFRFDDLKASLYSFERTLYPSLSEANMVNPDFFQLTTNYRSHGGIVNCAEIIIRLITHFWPHTIDALRKEKGLVDGSKPIFFTGWNDETARYEQFLLGENGNSIEFGAQQCILVRNDQARNELRKQVGEIGVILTLYESKGLEFDDVLLYNFFEDSPCVLSQWRAILGFMNEPDFNKKAAPRFDEIRHAGICTELKFLYVAVTRARKNLWIIDRSEKGEPMKTLLTSEGRVEICTPANAPKLAGSSTAEEWEKTGKLLFSNKRYPQAMHCFERAGLTHERAIAEAYHFRQQARNVPRGKSDNVRKDAFSTAARAFFSCAHDSSQSQRKKYYRIAAECFKEAKCDDSAAQAYLNAEEFTLAATHYRKASMFDEAVVVITNKRDSVDPEVSQRIIDVSRLHYFHVEEVGKAMKLFESDEAGLEFMEECGFDIARATVLEKIGRLTEAAEVHFLEGRIPEAIRVLLRDTRNQESIQRAVHYLLNGLWKQYAFGIRSEERNPNAVDFLSLSRDIDKVFISVEAVEELQMFEMISRQDRDGLLDRYSHFRFVRRNLPATILILDQYLNLKHQFESMQSPVPFLQACLRYAEIMRELWSDAGLVEKIGVQRLLGFRRISDEQFFVSDGFLLHSYAKEHRSPLYRTVENGLVLYQYDLLQLVKSSIVERLRNAVQTQHNLVVKSKLFGTPCLIFATQGRCYRSDCLREHVDSRNANQVWYNLRVRAHLIQILYQRTADFAIIESERIKMQRQWLTSLFNTLNPPIMSFGNMGNVLPEHIPEFDRGMNAVANWVEARAYGIHPNYLKARWFMDDIVEIAILAFRQDKEKARSFIHRARFYTMDGILSVHRPTLESYRIQDFINFIDASDPGFLYSGVIFVEHISKTRLTIDTGYLSQIIELLSTSFILISTHQRKGLHNCTLPKSWMTHLLPKLNFDHNYDLRIVWQLSKSVKDLLAQLLLDSTSDSLKKTLAIIRICRSICLIGYNIPDDALREEIVGIFGDLRKMCNIPPSFILREYIDSTSWSKLARIVQGSVLKSGLDEMIQLVKEGSQMKALPRNAKITRIFFGNSNEVPSILSPNRAGSVRLSAAAAVFVPKSALSAQLSQPEESSTTTTSLTDDEEEGAIIADDGQANLLERPTDVGTSEATNLLTATVILPTDQEDQAARVIQRRFRVLLHQRRDLENTGPLGKRAKNYKICEANLATMLYYLQDRIASDKQKAKKQLSLSKKTEDSNDDYDEVSRRMTQATVNRKRLERLKKDADPKSDWHSRRTFQDLCTLVLDVEAFLGQLNIVDAKEDICMVKKAIIQERKPRLKERPTLNTEDLEDMYDLV